MNVKKNSGRPVVLVDGCRLPFLRAGTGYASLTAYDLARMALKAILHKTQAEPEKIDGVILGTVIVNNKFSNVARQATLAAGLPPSIPAYTVSMACISANQAITNAMDMIATGRADVVIAGGTESLSDIPVTLRKPVQKKILEARSYRRALDYRKFVGGLSLSDLLPDVPAIAELSTGRTMGEDCDRLAARLGISRLAQDEFALRSHRLAAAAAAAGTLQKEVTPVRIPPEFKHVDQDNGIRSDSTLEKLQALAPAFVRPVGTITAGNASFLTDGAAMTLLVAEEAAAALGYTPRARLLAYAYSAQDTTEELLLGPAYAIPKVLDACGLSLEDIAVFEFHEAFAAQVLANVQCLASTRFGQENLGRREAVGEIPLERLNSRGGSLSLGHPFGATGARLLTTAANRLHEEDGQFALVASCAAGGIGNAIVLERLAASQRF